MKLVHLILMQPQQGDASGGFMSTIIMFSLIILIFYFMIIRPQKKRQKEREQLLNSIKKGDHIVTIGGIYGTVIGLEEKTVLVQVADNVKLKFERSAISTIVKEGNPERKEG